MASRPVQVSTSLSISDDSSSEIASDIPDIRRLGIKEAESDTKGSPSTVVCDSVYEVYALPATEMPREEVTNTNKVATDFSVKEFAQ